MPYFLSINISVSGRLFFNTEVSQFFLRADILENANFQKILANSNMGLLITRLLFKKQ